MNNPYIPSYYNHILKIYGRTDLPMSQSVLVKNNQASILSSESLFQELKYNSIMNKWESVGVSYGQKVFYNRNKKMIWSITGLNLNEMINTYINDFAVTDTNILSEQIKTLQKNISSYLQTSHWNDELLETKILLCCSINSEIYNALIMCSSNPDIKYNQVLFLFDAPLSLSIGSYADLSHDMIIDPSENQSERELLSMSEKYIKDVIDLDSQVLRFGFYVVGGPILSVSIDKTGNIHTYVNGVEKDF